MTIPTRSAKVARTIRPARALGGILLALLLALVAEGCVTCHCTPLIKNGDCNCERPVPGGR
ncbi:MAG TPA: hypothetical protein VGK30_08470 [Candidatus Binatia bacterium]